MTQATTWNDPNHCPFCGESLPNPGAGFVDHVDETPDCETKFTMWREQITEDISGGWGG